jgi:hypothetical protein
MRLWIDSKPAYSGAKVNSTSIDIHSGFVCSANGTSTRKVNIDGEGGTWSVTQSNYKNWLLIYC